MKTMHILLILSMILAPAAVYAADVPKPAVVLPVVTKAAEPKEVKTPEEEAKEAIQKEIAKMKLEMSLLETKQEYNLLKGKLEKKQNDILKAKVKSDLQDKYLDAATLEEQIKIKTQLDRIARLSGLNDVLTKLKTQVNKQVRYRKNPLDKDILVISDRRIHLNGGITLLTAFKFANRIHFFNNQSAEMPIFVVIDACPGGSGLAGMKMLQAMKSSKAPVYVVVKTYAASMAAIILTLADESYAFPNAIILHHEAQSFVSGSTSQKREAMKQIEELEKRVIAPVAKKMGLTLEEFRTEVHKHSIGGNWEEFADNALKLKWVNNIIQGVREEGIVVHPVITPVPIFLKEEIDEKGKPFIYLPRLTPGDAYFIHNPDNYYRMR